MIDWRSFANRGENVCAGHREWFDRSKRISKKLLMNLQIDMDGSPV
jgi:hypothetical protein